MVLVGLVVSYFVVVRLGFLSSHMHFLNSLQILLSPPIEPLNPGSVDGVQDRAHLFLASRLESGEESFN